MAARPAKQSHHGRTADPRLALHPNAGSGACEVERRTTAAGAHVAQARAPHDARPCRAAWDGLPSVKRNARRSASGCTHNPGRSLGNGFSGWRVWTMPWEHLGIPPQTWRSPVLLGAVSFGVPHSRCTAVARDLHVSVDITAPLDFALHLPNGSGPPLPRAVRHSLSTAADALYSTVGGFSSSPCPTK
jgi:hypothetical protein